MSAEGLEPSKNLLIKSQVPYQLGHALITGAPDRTRTGTVSLPADFWCVIQVLPLYDRYLSSRKSAMSAIPSLEHIVVFDVNHITPNHFAVYYLSNTPVLSSIISVRIISCGILRFPFPSPLRIPFFISFSIVGLAQLGISSILL